MICDTARAAADGSVVASGSRPYSREFAHPPAKTRLASSAVTRRPGTRLDGEPSVSKELQVIIGSPLKSLRSLLRGGPNLARRSPPAPCGPELFSRPCGRQRRHSLVQWPPEHGWSPLGPD